MVSPTAKMLAVMSGRAPISRATATVSPIARPNPSMTAPVMPPVEWGNTTPRIISQRVAPNARAPALSVGGTVVNTSLVTEVMIGVTINASTRAADA